ncbi:MAG: RnfABCDGE type electron transport complex subunit B [Elusimicrobia bacterium]|nr:RnfABCDGE type electron transport complex subunit B [Elusimicrobiota bacterium]
MTVIQSIIVFGSIGLVAGIILVIAYSKLKVEEDPKVEKILESLPGLNCGSCGCASCHEYAVLLAKGEAGIDLCRPGGPEVRKKLAFIMNMDSSEECAVFKAVIRCRTQERKCTADYTGPRTCAAAHLTGGGMACKYGCLGYGDCVEACPFGAISLDKDNFPVINFSLCTACGLCVRSCPRNLITLERVIDGRVVYVGCSNRQPGKETRKVCVSGCIACRICEKKAPEGTFQVKDNLSGVIRQDPGIKIDEIKCPTKCIYEMS